jgi:hypothetical protein
VPRMCKEKLLMKRVFNDISGLAQTMVFSLAQTQQNMILVILQML